MYLMQVKVQVDGKELSVEVATVPLISEQGLSCLMLKSSELM